VHAIPFAFVVSVDGAARKYAFPVPPQHCDECMRKLWGAVGAESDDDDDAAVFDDLALDSVAPEATLRPRSTLAEFQLASDKFVKARDEWHGEAKRSNAEALAWDGKQTDRLFRLTPTAKALRDELGGCSGELVLRELPLECYIKDHLHFFLRMMIILLRPIHRLVIQNVEAGHDGIGMFARGLTAIGLGHIGHQVQRNLLFAAEKKGFKPGAASGSFVRTAPTAREPASRGIVGDYL
jgi:hypothetical protein